MIKSPGSLLLEQLDARQLWVSSLAAGMGLLTTQVIPLLRDEQPITRFHAQLLSIALGGTGQNWIDDQYAYDSALEAGEPVQPAPPIPDWMLNTTVCTEFSPSLEIDGITCRALKTLPAALNWWLPRNQIFTLGALQEALRPLCSHKDTSVPGDKTIGMMLRPRKYHGRLERHNKERMRVWRYNPARFERSPE